jgi:hypothetical protein
VNAEKPSVIEQILDLALGRACDNTQPWRFELTGDYALIVHGFDTRALRCDFRRTPSQISLDALLETLRMQPAVTECVKNHTAFCGRGRRPFDVASSPTMALIRPADRQHRQAHPAARDAHHAARRGAESRTESSLGAGYRVVDRIPGERTRMASSSTERETTADDVRPSDASRSHQFNAVQRRPIRTKPSPDPVATMLMRWTMAEWSPCANTYLAGTVMPRIELDFIPGLACAAHFAIVANTPAASTDDYVNAGSAIQRLWLTATRRQLFLQPEMTPLIFNWYVRAGKRFLATAPLWDQAVTRRRRWQAFLGDDVGTSGLLRSHRQRADAYRALTAHAIAELMTCRAC